VVAGGRVTIQESGMKIVDRYLLRHFLFAYVASFFCLLGMYIVIDVFTKFEEFTVVDGARAALKQRRNATPGVQAQPQERVREISLGKQLRTFARNVGVYYGYRIPVFFQRANGILILLAAAFTLGWMERQNELTPLVASGVPMSRLMIPLAAATMTLLCVGVLNTELVIPRCAEHLLRQAEDPMGKRPLLVPGAFDCRRVHVEARVAYPQKKMIQHARVTFPPEFFGATMHVTSQEMYYRPGTDGEEHGWFLNGCKPETLPGSSRYVHALAPGQFFLETDLTYERLTRRPNWFLYQSTAWLLDVMENEQGTSQRSAVLVHVHQRLLTPLSDLMMLLLGLPLVAGRHEWNIFIRVGWCLLIFALLQGLGIAGGILAKNELLDPSMAAWFPLLLLGPLVPPALAGMKT
jgi:lipopolysaccharide export LptBFGC system permease protein LptF